MLTATDSPTTRSPRPVCRTWPGRTIADATEAIKLNPKYARPYATRGAAFLQKGDAGSAVTDLEECLRLEPDYAWARETLEVAKSKKK